MTEWFRVGYDSCPIGAAPHFWRDTTFGTDQFPQVVVTGAINLPPMPEDVNRDGVVDMRDLSMVRDAFNKRRETSLDWWTKYWKMDVNGDGVINFRDIAQVNRAFQRKSRYEIGEFDIWLAINVRLVQICGVVYDGSTGNLLWKSEPQIFNNYAWTHVRFEPKYWQIYRPITLFVGVATDWDINVKWGQADRYSVPPVGDGMIAQQMFVPPSFPDNIPTMLGVGQGDLWKLHCLGVAANIYRTITT